MPLQVLVGEFVGYSALFLRTIEGKSTCPQYHKLDPYKSCLVHTICQCRDPQEPPDCRGAVLHGSLNHRELP